MSLPKTKGVSEYDDLFNDVMEAEKQAKLTPQDVAKKQQIEHYDGLFRKSEEVDEKVKYVPKDPIQTEVSLWDDIKTAPAAGLRGFTQGMAVTADLIPTALNALGEYSLDAYDVVTGNGDAPSRNLDDVIRPWALSGLADDELGTTKSYEVGAISEVASDVGEAIPLLLSLGGGIARYGAKTMMQQGAVHPMFANYALKFGQAVKVDIAAIALGESVEELVETVAGEDSGWATAANISTSILGGWRLSQSKWGGVSDDVLKQTADEKGVMVASKDAQGISTLQGPAKVATVIGDSLTRPVAGVKKAVGALAEGTKNAVVGTAEAGLTGAAKLPFSNNVFREFKEVNGSFSNFLKEQKLLDTSARDYMKRVMNAKGTPAKKQYAQNLEVAATLGLKLDTYQLTGLEEFREFSLAVGALSPSKTLERIQHNLDVMDDFLTQKNLGVNEYSNNALQTALKKHHGETEEVITRMREGLVKARGDFIKETQRTIDKVPVSDDFLQAYEKYEGNLKELVGRGFTKAIPEDQMLNMRNVHKDFLDDVSNVVTEGLLPEGVTLPKIITQMIDGTATYTLPSGVKVTPKVQARDIHKSIVQLKKARKALRHTDPAFDNKTKQFIKAITSLEDTLATQLTDKQYKAYNAAKDEWSTIIGGKFNDEKVRKFTLKTQFNKLKSNGQDLIEELLNTAGSQETRISAINKLLTLSNDDIMKMAHRIDDLDLPNIDNISQATEVMNLKIKDYIVNDYLGKVYANPNRSPDEILQEYIAQQGRVIDSVLKEPLDLPKMAREVQRAGANFQARIDDELANALDIGSRGERKVSDWILNDLVKNKNEIKRLDSLLNNPEKLKKLGMDAEEIRETIGSHVVEAFITRDRVGSITGSTLFNELNKHGKNLEAILGTERYAHLKTFERGYGFADMQKSSQFTKGRADLNRGMVSEGGLKLMRQSLSTHLMVAHGFVSKTYAYSMRAIQLIGGLKNDGYKKFMTKMMLDPEFFQETIEATAAIKSHDDIVRLRLSLAHFYGIPTETMNSEEGAQQARSLMDASITLENSLFSEYEQEDVGRETVEGLFSVTEEDKVDVTEAPTVSPEVSSVAEEEVVTPAPTSTPDVPQATEVSNIPAPPEPTDPIGSLSTRKSLSEIRND